MSTLDTFLSHVSARFPSYREPLRHPTFTPTFVSPATISITRSDFRLIADSIQAIEASYLPLSNFAVDAASLNVPNRSVFMGYDFFITEDGPKLIEINTNAAGGILNALIADFRGLADGQLILDVYKKMFTQEWQAFGKDAPHVLILDESPEQQKTYFDMCLAIPLFQALGWSYEISDPRNLQWNDSQKILSGPGQRPVQMIYNRYCDFLLQSDAAKAVRKAWETATICLTPQPREYAILAEKGQLVHLSNPTFQSQLGPAQQQALRSVLPEVAFVREKGAAWTWENRKSLFFKPRSSFGSKGVYKGESISKKVFEVIVSGDYIAQPFFRPKTIQVETADGNIEFKYDIRAYVYAGQLQMVAARLFQGQAMNFQILGGGFAAVKIED